MSKSKVEVLGSLRLIFKLTNLYNKNGVHLKYNRNGDSVKIPDFIAFFFIVLPELFYGLLLIWAIIEEKFDLILVGSTSFSAVIALVQVTTAYISLATKTDSIVSIVDQLQEVVEQSR